MEYLQLADTLGQASGRQGTIEVLVVAQDSVAAARLVSVLGLNKFRMSFARSGEFKSAYADRFYPQVYAYDRGSETNPGDSITVHQVVSVSTPVGYKARVLRELKAYSATGQ